MILLLDEWIPVTSNHGRLLTLLMPCQAHHVLIDAGEPCEWGPVPPGRGPLLLQPARQAQLTRGPADVLGQGQTVADRLNCDNRVETLYITIL